MKAMYLWKNHVYGLSENRNQRSNVKQGDILHSLGFQLDLAWIDFDITLHKCSNSKNDVSYTEAGSVPQRSRSQSDVECKVSNIL